MILTPNIIAHATIWLVRIVATAGILPQIFLNYKVKSTNDLSNTYILIYLFGNIVQLVYIFCLDLPIAYKIMNPISFLLVIVLAFQAIFYNKNKSKNIHRLITLLCVSLFIIFLLIIVAINFPTSTGHLAGWISVVIWTIYQLPQVFKIYSRKSVAGFSFATISFAGFQNIIGLTATLALGVPLQSVLVALRGIIFFAIFCLQFWIYRKKTNTALANYYSMANNFTFSWYIFKKKTDHI